MLRRVFLLLFHNLHEREDLEYGLILLIQEKPIDGYPRGTNDLDLQSMYRRSNVEP